MTGPKLGDVPSAVAHAVAETLGDAYDCTRTWSAWRHGTMGPGDFYQVAEDGDRVAEIALAAINAWEASKPQPASAIDLEQFRMLAQGSVDALAQNKVYPADVSAAIGSMRHLLALIDGQANSLNEQLGISEELPPAIDLEQFWKLSDSWLAQAERVRALAPDKSTGLWAAAKELRDLLALIDGQGVSEMPQKGRCPNNAAPGGCQLPNRFCTFPSCDKVDELQPTKGEGE